MYTVEGSLGASFHMRSSAGTNAATTLGGVKNVSPRFLELVAVTPGARGRLVKARLGIAELMGLPTLLTQPPPVKPKMPHLSGWPSYLKGKVPLGLGTPSMGCDQRQRSTPPGTPRMDST